MAKRTGLGRGIGALIPTEDANGDRPVDVFFAGIRLQRTLGQDAKSKPVVVLM